MRLWGLPKVTQSDEVLISAPSPAVQFKCLMLSTTMSPGVKTGAWGPNISSHATSQCHMTRPEITWTWAVDLNFCYCPKDPRITQVFTELKEDDITEGVYTKSINGLSLEQYVGVVDEQCPSEMSPWGPVSMAWSVHDTLRPLLFTQLPHQLFGAS